jgi:hypothetical protein
MAPIGGNHCRALPAARLTPAPLNILLQQQLIPAQDGMSEPRSGGRLFRIGNEVT